MLILIHLVVTLVFIYINAMGCYIRAIKYHWKEDIILCFFWPITAPIGILAIIASDSRP